MPQKNKQDNQTMIVDVRQLVALDEAKSYLFCLNQNTHLVIQMLHSFYGYWRNRYTQNSEVKPYLQPTDEQYRLVLDSYDQGELEISQVTCLDDLITAINGLGEKMDTINNSLVAVANNSGCCGSSSGGAGTEQQEPDPYDETTTPEDPPPGFDTMASYREHKCNVADNILDTLVSDLQKISVISLVGVLITGLASLMAVVILTPIPFDDLIFVASVLITGLLAQSYLSELATIIASNASDLICVLYEASNAENARDELITALEGLIDDTAWDGTIKDQVKSLLPHLVTVDAINRMFSPGAQFEGDGDCSGCSTPCIPITSGLTIDIGSGSHIGAGVWEITGSYIAGWPCAEDAREVAIYLIPEGFTLTAWEIVSGTVTACGTDPYHAFEGLGSPYSGFEDSSEVGFGIPQSLGSLYVLSSTPFTIRFTLCQNPG